MICDEAESMEHIMINCKDAAAVAIRIALRETLEKRIGANAPPLQLGTALGAAASRANANAKAKPVHSARGSGGTVPEKDRRPPRHCRIHHRREEEQHLASAW